MKEKYIYPGENENMQEVNDPAIEYQIKNNKTELPDYDAERIQMQADQAIKDFEDGLCIPHEKIK